MWRERLLLSCGCGLVGNWRTDEVTTGGIEVYTAGYPIDLDYLDSVWLEEVRCWELIAAKSWPPDADLPHITILDPHEAGACDEIRMRWFDDRVHGHRRGRYVFLPPDLCALRHEYAHYVSSILRGDAGENGEGVCGLR